METPVPISLLPLEAYYWCDKGQHYPADVEIITVSRCVILVRCTQHGWKVRIPADMIPLKIARKLKLITH